MSPRTFVVFIYPLLSCLAVADPSPAITSVGVSNAQEQIQFQLYPAAQQYKMLGASGLGQPMVEMSAGSFSGNLWTAPVNGPVGFYRLAVTPMDPNQLLTTTVLNRLAYGPTPDELVRVQQMGAQAYINEQLAPELLQENLPIDTPSTNTGWQRYIATGTASSATASLAFYLNGVGNGYLDDVQLVAGTNADVGVNLIRNGDFEQALTNGDWGFGPNLVKSVLTTEAVHSGASSLKIISTLPGTSKSTAVSQNIAVTLNSGHPYTLSFWYLPSTSQPFSLKAQMTGIGISTTTAGSLLTQLQNGELDIDGLRSWYVQRAIQSKRQLLEVLVQFVDNHFVTEYTKTSQFFENYYQYPLPGRTATSVEFTQQQRWRQALLNPQCTFYDLLRISAESPGMIIYLDTVTSRGDGNPPQIANENYARELLELFNFGVNNGYDQNDIVEISKCWTGWRVEMVDSTNQFNPLARRMLDEHGGVNITNLNGVWAFNYRPQFHNNGTKKIFPGKVVPARFGPPYAGRSYELDLPARTGTNGVQDGYDLLAHLANQPFTQEFISVKLCRLLVHDNFDIGYDFTDPNLSPEGQLVQQCMQAWESSQGQIRVVLSTIFNSPLFQSNAASMQKVKTPLEFTVSALRALWTANGDGTYTAQTDGNIGAILNRMGGMALFDRVEPDGYPEVAAPWVSAGTLAERLRFVQALLIAKNQAGRSDAGNSFVDPVGLLKNKLSASEWNSADVVVDYFLSILYPAEGTANLGMYRAAALQFLNTADNGTTASPFAGVSTNSATYDTRVRGMVAMLMTFQRFQEQ